MAKGGQFERDVCKELSLWWTEGERDDIFWRTSGSGARAKTRSRQQNKTTAYSYGDVTFTDPIGQPLIAKCILELKRGYGKWSPLDLVDRPKMRKNAKKMPLQTLESFIEQVMEDVTNAGGFHHPILICRRDGRRKFIGITDRLFRAMVNMFGYPETTILRINTNPSFRFMSYRFFLDWCHPDFFKSC